MLSSRRKSIFKLYLLISSGLLFIQLALVVCQQSDSSSQELTSKATNKLVRTNEGQQNVPTSDLEGGQQRPLSGRQSEPSSSKVSTTSGQKQISSNDKTINKTQGTTGAGDKLADGPKRQSGAGEPDDYLVGVGIADITGPAADINLMGYAKPNQDAGGIHLRQFSRSIIVEDSAGSRVLYVSIDNGMVSQLLRSRVLAKLANLYGTNTYNESNLMISASHTHSAPGGFFQYMLYNIPSAGFVQQTLESLISGIVKSIERAHESKRSANIYLSQGLLLDASVNRSPYSYQQNPIEERLRYKHDTDKMMTLLKFVDAKTRQPFAMVNWFPVHATSMNNTNRLISSDNKGYASLLFEQTYGQPGALPGKSNFVAIFAQANEGDVSPNTQGPRCIDTGLPCDLVRSTCGQPGRNEKCIAFGPGKDMFESTLIIAHRQFDKAKELFEKQTDQEPVKGPVRFAHEYVDMSRQQVPLYESVIGLSRIFSPPPIKLNDTYETCSPALGYSFAAGTTDGPGAFDFRQADTASGRYWNMVRDFLKRPSQAQRACHKPKPILLSTGEMDFPYAWHPRIVPTQLLAVGQVAIVGLPGEFTTMAGRRVRRAVRAALSGAPPPGQPELDDYEDDEDYEDEEAEAEGENEARYQSQLLGASQKLAKPQTGSEALASRRQARKLAQSSQQDKPAFKVVLSGLSNVYTSYVATLEEYCVQRYEAASTLYGPHTLQAYVNQFARLGSRLAAGQAPTPAPTPPTSGEPRPPDLSDSLFGLKPGVIFDGPARGHHFGDLLVDVVPNKTYTCKELVSVAFVAANPRNDLRHEDSFLYVDQYKPEVSPNWQPVASDASWETKFIWERTSVFLGESKAIVEWQIPAHCKSGVYRIRHLGAAKSLFKQSISQYMGQSSFFKVLAPDTPAQEAVQLDEWLAKLRASSQSTAISENDDASINNNNNNNNNSNINSSNINSSSNNNNNNNKRLDASSKQPRDNLRSPASSILLAPFHMLNSFFSGR